MDRIIVFHGLTEIDGESKVYGVVRVPNNKLLQQIKSDAAKGMGFDELMFKYKLRQADGECIAIND